MREGGCERHESEVNGAGREVDGRRGRGGEGRSEADLVGVEGAVDVREDDG